MSKIHNMLESTIQKIREMVDVNSVIGEPISTPDGVTIIPVSKVSVGFGGGGSDFTRKTAAGDNPFGGGVGGGVKVTSFAVLILTIRSVAQGRDDCVIGGHHIESKTVYRALTIIVIGAVAAFGSAVVVYYNTAETVSVIDCIFESCSAFGTVGLSVGVTGQLNTGAKLLYMACMFMGRVGPVSLAISLTAKPDDNKRKVLPVGHINVG